MPPTLVAAQPRQVYGRHRGIAAPAEVVPGLRHGQFDDFEDIISYAMHGPTEFIAVAGSDSESHFVGSNSTSSASRNAAAKASEIDSS